MKSTKVIILDFDNCVALDERTREGSEEIKDHAWFVVFPEYEREVLHPVLEDSKRRVAGGKGDRRDVARDVLRHFRFSSGDLAAEIEKRCDCFNQTIQEGIKNITLSNTWRQALAELKRCVPLYLNTATPRYTVLQSLEALEVARFFKAVYGRPGTKVENLRSICATESIHPAEALFVDDQPSGYEAARTVGMPFVGIDTARNDLWRNTPQPFPVILSLSELVPMVSPDEEKAPA